MRSRFTIFGLALFFPLFGAVAASSADSQIEQSRQFGSTFRPPEVQVEGGDAPIQPVVIDLDDESFGAQQILKRVEKIQPFNAFADVSAFYTNNVALTRRKTLGRLSRSSATARSGAGTTCASIILSHSTSSVASSTP